MTICSNGRKQAFLWLMAAAVSPLPAAPLGVSFCRPKLVSRDSPSSLRSAAAAVADTIVDAIDYEDEMEARSAFGTKSYWDEVYSGMGDFPKEEYSWYYGFHVMKPHLIQAVPQSRGHEAQLLLPGIGNDPMLLDLQQCGYKNLVAFDYSEHAIARQEDLLAYQQPQSTSRDTVELYQMDARALRSDWTTRFDAILEKGALDAIYLSGDGNVEASVKELTRVLKPGGVIVSVSGVIPEELRRDLFRDYDWIRDGSNDLQAGCFVFRKPLE